MLVVHPWAVSASPIEVKRVRSPSGASSTTVKSSITGGETVDYTLSAGITGSPDGTAPKSDAKVAGTPYHATGQAPCSIGHAAQGSAQCAFGVVRGKPGNA